MFRNQFRTFRSASSVCVLLFGSIPLVAQQVVHKGNSSSIISLAPSPKPVGQNLARQPGDAHFDNAPANYHVFAAVGVGENAGTEVLNLKFAAETSLTSIKLTNREFVLQPGGSCYQGNHYHAGDSCSVLLRFTPQGPGHRLGFLKVANSAEASLASFGLIGNGFAPVISFTPSLITTVPDSVSSGTGTLSTTTNIAVDGGDVVYIADTGNNKLKTMDSTGSIFPSALSPIATPVSVAVDSFGIVYTANVHTATYYFSIFYPWGSQTAYGYAYTSNTCTPSAPCAFSAVGMNYPAGMSIDSADNLFFEEGTTGAAEMPVTSISGGSGTLNLWHLSDQFSYSSGSPASFAVDTYGDLFTFYHFSTTTCMLLEEFLYNAEYSPTANRVAGGTACGFSGDGGLARGAEISTSVGQMAFDLAGNLYFADSGNQRVRRVDARTGIISTIAGNGTAGFTGDGGAATSATLSSPTGVGVDSQGQVYIVSNAPSDGPTQALRKIGVNGYWKFAPLLKGSTAGPRVFTVANTGNDTLIFTSASLTGPNKGDFSIDPDTTTCILTPGTTLPAGRSCKIGVFFKPTAAGTRNASLQILDNTVTGTNSIVLVGTGTLPQPTMAITSPTGGSTVAHGTQVTFAVSVTSTSSTKPTGTVTFKVAGAAIGSPVALNASGVASTTFSEATAKTYSLSATYNGDTNYAAITKSESLIVSAPNPIRLTAASKGQPGADVVSKSGR